MIAAWLLVRLLVTQTVEITTPDPHVELGKAFPLTVVRTWTESGGAHEWRDELLAPLVVRLVDTSLCNEAGRIEETRRYDAYAFARGEITVEQPSGGPLRIHVGSALPAGEAGAPELPGGPLLAPISARSTRAFAVAVVAAAALLVALAGGLAAARKRARRRGRAPTTPPAVPPDVVALARLDHLRRQGALDLEQTRATFVESAALLRDYLHERFAAPATFLTTEELADAPSLHPLAAAHHELLAELLTGCDQVKFARRESPHGERAALLDRAERFVLETRSS